MELKIEENASKESSSSKSEIRKNVCQQMEFYFSDANLTKDRFLKKEITSSPDGYVDLNTFFKFNKIRQLKVSFHEVVKSIKKYSTKLELNEAETMVRRVDPFVEPSQKDVDKRTIYVENLPNKVTDAKLRSYFSEFGTVCYVSLPKFQSSNQYKGFAFIEFSSKQDAKKAVEVVSERNPNQTCPIGKFPKSNAQIIELEKKVEKAKHEIVEFKAKLENDVKPGEKRKLNTYSDSKADLELQPPKEKSKKLDVPVKQPLGDFSSIRAVRKKEWLKLKEEFLNKQKEEVNELKSQLSLLTKELDELKEGERRKKWSNQIAKSSSHHVDDIERGCIIKVQLDADKNADMFKLTRQKFKDSHLSEISSQIAYVDLDKHTGRVYIRCNTSEIAKELIANKSQSFLAEFDKSLLAGKEEEFYLEKIAALRDRKQEKKERKQTPKAAKPPPVEVKQSDHNQLTKESEPTSAAQSATKSSSKHIVFDNDDE